MRGRWVVDIKGGPNEEHFEISVMRDDNKLGRESYGWFGRDKLLVTHNGGPCHWALTERIWDRCVSIAKQTADELNREENKE